MKRVIIVLLVLIGVGVAWYLLSPVFITVEKDEALPFALPAEEMVMEEEEEKMSDLSELEGQGMVRGLESMDEEMREEFEAEMEKMKDEVMEMDDEMAPLNEGPRVVASGDFRPHAHEVEGEVHLIEFEGERILRFEDFETINGPNLHIYLASDVTAEDYIDLGKIRATKGNVNYEVSADIDTTKYNKVLVWCVPFKVLFSYAELAS